MVPMHTNGGNGSEATGVSRGPNRSQAIRAVAARILRLTADRLDPPRPTPLYVQTANGTSSNSTPYRLTFLR